MAKLNLIETIQTKLSTLSKKDGQLIVVRDNASLYIDLDGSRIYISDWIDVSTDEERLAMISPLSNKYYYVIATNKIWRYISGSWVLISSININEHIEDTDIHVTTTDKTNWNVAYTHSQSEHAPSDAEKNQNAFSNVKVDSTTIAADTTTDTLTLVAGNNVTITPDATNDKITISAKDTTYSAFVKSGSGAKAGLVPTPSTTAGTTKYLREDGTWQIPAGTGVRNISTGATNGTINVNLNGMDFEVAVKGLGSAAYTNSGVYAAASHGTHVTYGTSAKALGTSSAGSATTVSRSDHVHALPALTSCTGTLTIAKGGTGATDAATALINLGAAASGHTHSVATTTENGLMTSTDKAKLDATNIGYGTCSTDATTAEKEITITSNDNWQLSVGSIIIVKFTNTNTATNPKLNVNGTGAKSVWLNTGVITTNSSQLTYAGTAKRPIKYVYDGTNWIFMGWSADTNTTYSTQALGNGYGKCTTAAATVAKVVSLSSYTLKTGGFVAVKFTYNVPASATMNINSKGAKNIFYRGSTIIDGVIKAGDIALFVYDGTQYDLLCIDRNISNTEITSSVEPDNQSIGEFWLSSY